MPLIRCKVRHHYILVKRDCQLTISWKIYLINSGWRNELFMLLNRSFTFPTVKDEIHLFLCCSGRSICRLLLLDSWVLLNVCCCLLWYWLWDSCRFIFLLFFLFPGLICWYLILLFLFLFCLFCSCCLCCFLLLFHLFLFLLIVLLACINTRNNFLLSHLTTCVF